MNHWVWDVYVEDVNWRRWHWGHAFMQGLDGNGDDLRVLTIYVGPLTWCVSHKRKANRGTHE